MSMVKTTNTVHAHHVIDVTVNQNYFHVIEFYTLQSIGSDHRMFYWSVTTIYREEDGIIFGYNLFYVKNISHDIIAY